MKRLLIFIALAVIVGAVFAHLISTKASYVLISYEHFAFESSLWFFLIMLFIGYFVFNLFLALLLKLYRPRHRFQLWALNRRMAASKREFHQALLDFEVGAWDKALRKFRSAATNLERPIVAYLFAARAANKLQREDVQEEMLHQAAQLEPNSSLAIGLVRAELLIESGKSSEAKEVLQAMKQASPRHHRVNSLLESLES